MKACVASGQDTTLTWLISVEGSWSPTFLRALRGRGKQAKGNYSLCAYLSSAARVLWRGGRGEGTSPLPAPTGPYRPLPAPTGPYRPLPTPADPCQRHQPYVPLHCLFWCAGAANGRRASPGCCAARSRRAAWETEGHLADYGCWVVKMQAPCVEWSRKMTAAPAARLGLADRGLLRTGLAADIRIFDPESVIDRADWKNLTLPEGYRDGDC